MSAVEIKPGSWWIGVNVRTHDLFEGLWPIPHGVSLNSYLIKGEKVAVIELVREWSGSARAFMDQLRSAGVSCNDIDYIVLNHLEPDHTEFLRNLREMAPAAQIVSTPKGIEMVKHFHGIETGLQAVEDGEELDLGAGKKLVFYHTPFVHWPETMMTYEPGTEILYSCDAFGGFGVLKGIIFDDQVSEPDVRLYYEEMLRYYANIVANFSRPVTKALAKLGGLAVSTIAPSHGLIWRTDPGEVIARYQKFAGYSSGQAEPAITVVWGSMYGNTKTATDAVMRGIAREKVPMEVFEVPGVEESYILASIFKNRGVVVGAPTYETGLFPPMAHLLDSVARKRMVNRKTLRFGSFGWSGGAQREFDALAERLKWEQSEALEFRGAPTEDDLRRAEDAGALLARQVRS
jgi:anaerobic nitric oxide reductase flavorubredoxin